MEIIILLLGLSSASLGGFLLWDGNLVRRHAEKGVGRVIAFRIVMESQGQTRLSPIISYMYEGKKYLFTSQRRKSALNKILGDKVTIEIPHKDPGHSYFKSYLPSVFSGFFLLAGMSCTIAFFSMFELKPYSIAIIALVSIALSYQTAAVLRRKGIHSLNNNYHTKASRRGYAKSLTPQKKCLKAILFGTIFCALMATSIYLNIEKWQFMQQAVATTGIVTAYDRQLDALIISFSPEHTTYPITFTDQANAPQLRLGTHVNVLYLPNNPQQAIINNGFLTWVEPIFFILLSIMVTTIAAILVKQACKHRD